MTADLIPIIERVMKEHSVRSFLAKVIKDAFDTEMVSIHVHFNDLRSCMVDELFTAIGVACKADVAFSGENNAILVRPIPQAPRDTTPLRFAFLMDELDKRFPKGAEHRLYCAEPPELHLLREIDERLGAS